MKRVLCLGSWRGDPSSQKRMEPVKSRKPATCGNCMSIAHIVTKCTEPCGYCGSIEHHNSKKCPEKPAPKVRRPPTCSNCGSLDHNVSTCEKPCGHCESTEHHNKNTCRVDTFTAEALKEYYTAYKNTFIIQRVLDEKYRQKTRAQCLPEHISENIIKFILNNKCGFNAKWGVFYSGDLYISDEDGVSECKSYISGGPSSYTPTSTWKSINFLDCRNFLEDKFICWRTILTTAEFYKLVQVNKIETMEDHANSKRRPRIAWDVLYPYIKDCTTKIFEGSFEEIFKPVKAPVCQQSASPPEPTLRSLPACTDESLPGPEACSLEETPGN